MNEDELEELLRTVDSPEGGPVDFGDRLWDELAAVLDEGQPAIRIGDEPESRGGVPLIGRPETAPERVGSDRRWLVGIAAAIVVIFGLGALAVLTLDDDSPITEQTADAPDTTTSTTSSTTTVAPVLEFVRPLEVGQIGETFATIRFTSSLATEFTATATAEDTVVGEVTDTANANSVAIAAFENLEPGTEYEVLVTLTGPPIVRSETVIVRTSGEVDSTAAEEPVELLNLRLADVQATQFQVDYETNTCANGSFVIFDSEGVEVGRNDGQPEGCTTQHLAVPGMWTPELEPNSIYTIVVTVEANGAGLGDGNIDTESLEVTTAVE